MSQVQCPQGHFYNNEIYSECPYCHGAGGGDNPPPPSPPENNNKWLVIKILSIIMAVVAIGSFVYVQSLESELLSLKNELKTVTRDYDAKTKELNTNGSVLNISKKAHTFFKSLFGSDGQDFYMDTPILVLESGGSSKTLQLHRKAIADNTWLNLLHNYTKGDFTSGCCNDVEADWENGNIKVTSGSAKGFNILHVFDSNGKSFDVLIIVK